MELNESENLELKESWHDDHLKVICAFSNTCGGKLVLGITDKHEPSQPRLNIKKLLENIPNKVLSKLGIITTIQADKFKNKEIIIIRIEKSSVPISYNGHYFIRIGSTTQILEGKKLHRFLINTSLSNWDEYVVEDAKTKEFDIDTINEFKKLAYKRLPFVRSEISLKSLLVKLNLTNEKGKIKRGAVLLFGKNPRKYFISAFIKIGKFNDDGSIISSDIIEGNLFQQVKKILELIKTKYLISEIKIEGLNRKEYLAIPEEALREAILNAVIHRDYIGAHTQIKIYRDHLTIWNEGNLPEPIKIADLKSEHPSKPRNELLADIFFKAGYIEAWGQGTLEIINICRNFQLPEPEYREEFGGFSVTFFLSEYHKKFIDSLKLNHRQKELLNYLKENDFVTNTAYQELFSVSKGTATQDLMDLVSKSVLDKTGTRGAGTHYKLKK